MRTGLVDGPAGVAGVGFVVRVQDLQRVEVLQLLQVQEVFVRHVAVSNPQSPQVREQPWEESDQGGGGAPRLQVQVL